MTKIETAIIASIVFIIIILGTWMKEAGGAYIDPSKSVYRRLDRIEDKIDKLVDEKLRGVQPFDRAIKEREWSDSPGESLTASKDNIGVK